MNISEQTLAVQSHAMAVLAKSAYKKDCKSHMMDYGFIKDYKYLNNDGAEAHIASSDTHIVVAIRGTEISDKEDWIRDAQMWPKTHGPGWVHTGFRKAGRKLLPLITDYILARPNREVYITGHSLGGAMGLYIAQELEWKTACEVTLFTYGSPRLGNRDYVKAAVFPHHRFVNSSDIVPHIPPFILGYRHHGTMHYISRSGKICKPTSLRRVSDFVMSKYDAWKTFKPIGGIADHSMSAYVEKLSKISEI